MTIRSFRGITPKLAKGVWIADSADVIGDVELGEDVSIWFGTVLRGDVMPIRIGARSNIQDLSMSHGTDGMWGVEIGEEVTVGHRAVVHGCTIADRVLIGMGAVILDGCKINEGAVIAAGSVLSPGTTVPARTMWAGVPAKQRREITDIDWGIILGTAEHYRELAREFAAG